MTLSIVVIAKDEEKMLAACLESAKWADELVVIDNGSTDQTQDIARSYTSKVYSLSVQDFAKLRNFAWEKTKGEWVLYLDADERLTDQSIQEIKTVISKPEHYSAYALKRLNVIFGRLVTRGPYQNDWMIRLFHRPDFYRWVGRVHEHPEFKGELGFLQQPLIHLTHRDVDQIVKKSLEWSKIDAQLRLEADHPQMSSWRFLRILFTELYNQLITRKGFLNGTVGVMDALLQTFSLLITYIRLWQLQQPVPIEKIYKQIDQDLVANKFSIKVIERRYKR